MVDNVPGFPMNVADDQSVALSCGADDVESSNYMTDDSVGTSNERGATIRNGRIDTNSPEALVRQETNDVNSIRTLGILMLMTAAICSAVLVHSFTKFSELDTFHIEFNTTAETLVESFNSDMQLKFYMSQTISSAITGFMQDTDLPHYNISIAEFSKLVRTYRWLAHSSLVSWTPYLKDREERSAFEAYASYSSVTHDSEGVPPENGCNICGPSGTGFINPTEIVDIQSIGNVSCNTIEDAGRYGQIDLDTCLTFADTMLANVATTNCICGNVRASTNDAKQSTRVPGDGIFTIENGILFDDTSAPPYHPVWQTAGIEGSSQMVMFNEASVSERFDSLQAVVKTGLPSISAIFSASGGYYDLLGNSNGEPTSILYFPVVSANGDLEEVVGTVGLEFQWKKFTRSIYPRGSEDVAIVIENTCGQIFTFRLAAGTSQELELVASGDFHDVDFEDMVKFSTYEDYDVARKLSASNSNVTDKDSIEKDKCRYRYLVYPTKQMKDKYVTRRPFLMTLATVGIFAFTSLIFILYDTLIDRRQEKLMSTAKRTDAIVDSLFPQNVKERLMAENDANANKNEQHKYGMEKFLENPGAMKIDTEPIADLFPNTTIMFVDIVGFTQWSSERDPSQVFRLLETLYQAFDVIARRKRIFKVETIGDTYVAVAGLPDPRPDHATVMARFSFECLKKMQSLTKELEVQLGPSTADLSARFGLHSGPVTGGVLRGEKARFQLFGDTMNTASRMESTGVPGRIQATRETAELLVAAGKSHWVTSRNEVVVAKGKGEMQTFWIDPSVRSSSGTPSVAPSTLIPDQSKANTNSPLHDSFSKLSENSEKTTRLVDWNVELLSNLLLSVDNNRSILHKKTGRANAVAIDCWETNVLNQTSIVMEELVERIEMPMFDSKTAASSSSSSDSLDPVVKAELREYIMRIASMYRDVQFHSFEHASHVAMSAAKLMKRIVDPTDSKYQQRGETSFSSTRMLESIHKSTFGISSDPLMQFTVVLAALIHDVDHTGLSNAELIRMKSPAARVYQNRSIAEQNSIDVAWRMLMGDEFESLRACIYSSLEELRRFRQLLVNAVLATDIADKDLQALRQKRWTNAFGDATCPDDLSDFGNKDHVDAKATIVFEYTLQASDVAHTMQHFLTYSKWNEKFFRERYVAFLTGHDETDPSIGWYKGELWFFDNYIIPLAQRLEECGAFGVSGVEYLSYAKQNRHEWEQRGHSIVARMKENAAELRGVMGGV